MFSTTFVLALALIFLLILLVNFGWLLTLLGLLRFGFLLYNCLLWLWRFLGLGRLLDFRCFLLWSLFSLLLLCFLPFRLLVFGLCGLVGSGWSYVVGKVY